MSDSATQTVPLKQAAGYASTEAEVTSLTASATEPSVCSYPENYYALLQASFRAIEALKAGDSEAVKMLTEAQSCDVFPTDLKNSAQKALIAIQG